MPADTRSTAPDIALHGALHGWLRRHVAQLLGLPEATVDPTLRFERYGLDSAALVGMTGELADWLGCAVEPAAPYEHPTVDALAAALSQREAVRAAYAARQAQVGGAA